MRGSNIYVDFGMIREAIIDLAHSGFFWLLVASIAIDVLLGVFCAIKNKCVNSSIGINGGLKHATVIVITLFLGVVLRIAKIEFVSYVSAIYFIIQYFISIIENAGKLGADIPPFLVKYLDQLNEKYCDEDVVDIHEVREIVVDSQDSNKHKPKEGKKKGDDDIE